MNQYFVYNENIKSYDLKKVHSVNIFNLQFLKKNNKVLNKSVEKKFNNNSRY